VAAVLVGGTAAGVLVLVRARQQQRKRELTGVRALQRGVRDVAGDLRKRMNR
jgi:hypothetical protein